MNSKCTICQMEFKDDDVLRTLRCLHMFHKECIDRWLLTVNGACVVCKVKQVNKKHPQQRELSPTSQAAATTN